MTEDAKPVAAEESAAVSDEQLRKAEAYVESEEGAATSQMWMRLRNRAATGNSRKHSTITKATWV